MVWNSVPAAPEYGFGATSAMKRIRMPVAATVTQRSTAARAQPAGHDARRRPAANGLAEIAPRTRIAVSPQRFGDEVQPARTARASAAPRRPDRSGTLEDRRFRLAAQPRQQRRS